MRTSLTIAAVLTLLAWAVPVGAEEGGYVDPATGLVWSPSMREVTDSWWTWDGSQALAASTGVWDVDAFGVPTFYDDWRVPTVKELQKAVADGTIQALLPRNPDGSLMYHGTVYLWSSESRGNKGWAVSVVIDKNGNVTGGGKAIVAMKDSALDVFLVRP